MADKRLVARNLGRFFIILILILPACQYVNINLPTSTRIPDPSTTTFLPNEHTATFIPNEPGEKTGLGRPVSEMNARPIQGVSGDDTIGDAYIPSLGNTGYDVQQYTLAMKFSSDVNIITATVTIDSFATIDQLGRISLDFTGYQVDRVLVGGQDATYYRSPNKLYIDLPESYTKGEKLVVQVSYHGEIKPQQTENSPFNMGLWKPLKEENFVFALAEPDGAHTWFPSNDHPLDKAAYRFEITVPGGETAVANGTLLHTIPSGDQNTFIWSETEPMATYLATVVVGKYQRIDSPAVGSVKIRHYVFEGDKDFSKELEKTQSMLQFFSDLIGPFPFNEFGYIIVNSNDLQPPVGMETQTMVIMDRILMFDQLVEYILAHEMVHQWFGDSVSLENWNEVWLKEGLAEYLTFLWLDHQGQEISNNIGNYEKILINDKLEINRPLNQPFTAYMYGNNTYLKGAWVFYMLREEMGKEAFSEFLQEYYQRFAGGNATTTDLQMIAEKVSGKNLDTFFKEWVYGSGIPDLHVTWTGQPDKVTVQVCQANREQVFTIPLEINIKGENGKSEMQIIQVDQKQEQVTYTVPFSVTNVLVDPEQRLLAEQSITKVEALQGCGP